MRAMNSKAVGHEQKPSRGKIAHTIALVPVTVSNAYGCVVPVENAKRQLGTSCRARRFHTLGHSNLNRALEVTVGHLYCPSESKGKVKGPCVSKILDTPTFRTGVVHPVHGTWKKRTGFPTPQYSNWQKRQLSQMLAELRRD